MDSNMMHEILMKKAKDGSLGGQSNTIPSADSLQAPTMSATPQPAKTYSPPGVEGLPSADSLKMPEMSATGAKSEYNLGNYADKLKFGENGGGDMAKGAGAASAMAGLQKGMAQMSEGAAIQANVDPIFDNLKKSNFQLLQQLMSRKG